MKKKKASYYPKAVVRKISARLFHAGLLNDKKHEETLKDIISRYRITKAKYIDRYVGFNYLDGSFKEQLEFKNGVAISEKGGDSNPLTPAVYALHLYNQYHENHDSTFLKDFEKQFQFLESTKKSKNNEYFWEYTTGVERFDIEAPWMSGISQGIIASVYLRKYQLSKDETYLQTAKRIIDFCFTGINGLYTDLGDSMYWIEEYPSAKGEGVLNGFLFFLIALGELNSMIEGYGRFDEGLESLLLKLPGFHKGKYIKYSKNLPDLGNETYQQIHYWQMEHLYQLTGNKVFDELKTFWLLASGMKL